MKDKETKDGEKLESVDSSGESVYSSAKEFDEDYETTLHEPRPSAGRVVHRNNCTSHRADRSGEPFFQPRLDPMSDKNWMIRIKIHVIKTYMWNVSRRPCLLDSLILRRFYLLKNLKYTCTPTMFQDFLLWIFACEFEQVWSRKILERQRNCTKKKYVENAKVVPSCVKNSLFVYLFFFRVCN